MNFHTRLSRSWPVWWIVYEFSYTFGLIPSLFGELYMNFRIFIHTYPGEATCVEFCIQAYQYNRAIRTSGLWSQLPH
jgi:hypothetical protein